MNLLQYFWSCNKFGNNISVTTIFLSNYNQHSTGQYSPKQDMPVPFDLLKHKVEHRTRPDHVYKANHNNKISILWQAISKFNRV
jgi:hypothetical protein